MKETEKDNLTKSLFFVVIALILIFGGPLVTPPEIAILLIFIGCGFAGIGIWQAFNFIRLEQKKFKKDKRGALWIWAVCLLAIVTLAVAWFALTWPAFMLIETIEGAYDFPSEVQPAINLIKTVMGWFLILMCLGLLLWAYVNSQRREEVTYPYG